MTDAVDRQLLEEVKEVVEPTLLRIAERLEVDGQELSKDAKEEFGLVRAPPVGLGKTNVHFEEYESEEHAALEKLASQSRFDLIVREYVGCECSLYEAGASITTAGGEGMEFHRDGNEGEVTILMSLSDIPEEQGQLGVIPGSHKNTEEQMAKIDDSRAFWLSYRAGEPMVIDARTQHAVRPNVSSETRVILWFIYN